MTAKEMLPYLKKCNDMFNAINQVYDAHRAAYGGDPEAPMPRAMFDCFDAYVEAVTVIVGDQCGWLTWWLWDNNQGKSGLTANSGKGRRMRKVPTLRALAKRITEMGRKR